VTAIKIRGASTAGELRHEIDAIRDGLAALLAPPVDDEEV
jgi:hypothetical protein